MTLSDIVLNVVEGTSVTSFLRNHRDWLMHLLAVSTFGKINLDSKNRSLAFLQYVIYILCENTHAQSAVEKKKFCLKNTPSVQRP